MEPINTSPIALRHILKFIFLAILSVFIIGYVLFQARNLIGGPVIQLVNEPQSIQTNQMVLLEGETRNIVSLTLNGREIHTDEAGVFSERLVLESGYTIMTLRAADRYGRTESLQRQFVYVPAT